MKILSFDTGRTWHGLTTLVGGGLVARGRRRSGACRRRRSTFPPRGQMDWAGYGPEEPDVRTGADLLQGHQLARRWRASS